MAKEKVVLAYSGGLDTAALTSDRKKNWTVWKKEPFPPVPQNYILRT